MQTHRRAHSRSLHATQPATNVTNKLVALIFLVAIGGLYGCNTFEGAGKNIQSGGTAMSDTARDAKKEMRSGTEAKIDPQPLEQ
jgi:entericidin B